MSPRTTPLALLALELAEAVERHERIPCAEQPELFVSENPDERAAAAALCVDCPARVREACARAGKRQRFGVWGGVDVAPREGRQPGRPRKASA